MYNDTYINKCDVNNNISTYGTNRVNDSQLKKVIRETINNIIYIFPTWICVSLLRPTTLNG